VKALAKLREAVVLPYFRVAPTAPPDDEAAFDRYAAELTAQYGLLASAFMIAVTLLWWPVDALVGPDTRYREVFDFLRARALVIFVAALVTFLLSRRASTAALSVAPVFYAAMVACIGYSLGLLGEPGLAWLADAAVALIPPALIPLRPGRRAVTLLVISALLPAAFFLPFPENLHVPLARGQASFFFFAYLLAMLIGEVLHRVLRSHFFQQRSLDRARAELAALNASLAERVAAQTRDLRALADHLDRVQETERRRVSRELHDELGQRLTAMRYQLTILEERARRQPETVPPLAAELMRALEETTRALRGVVTQLRPRVLDDLGLTAAVEGLCEQMQATGDVDCRLAVSRDVAALEARLDPEDALLLFRMVQEATTNARKHAGATLVEVSLDARGDALTAIVRDDGVGFDPSAPTGGFGLLGLSERAQRRGRRLVVTSTLRHGTTIALTACVDALGPGQPEAA
jgi:signal transduction histidine kinase